MSTKEDIVPNFSLLNPQIELVIEVETRNIQEVQKALAVQVDRIMLDNFDIVTTKEAKALICGRCEVESSGRITEDTLTSFAECSADYTSVGALTHHMKGLDMSLNAY